jgi:hypothetical protein
MTNWVLKGLRTGIKTTGYPREPEKAAGVSPGRPIGAVLEAAVEVDSLVDRCPTVAIARHDGGVAIEQSRCIHCLRCRRDSDGAVVRWDSSYEWGTYNTARMVPLRLTNWRPSSADRFTSALLTQEPAVPASARPGNSTIPITTCTASVSS